MELERLTLGGTLNFTTSVADYLPTDGWTLKYRLVPRSAGTPIDITSSQDSADSSLHRVQIAAVITATWGAGAYSWASWVEKGTEKYDVDDGVITLLPDPRTATTLDSRSPARKALDDAKAAFAAWSPTSQKYRIGDREMQFATRGDIIGVVSFWETEVQREENVERIAKGLKTKRQVYLRGANG